MVFSAGSKYFYNLGRGIVYTGISNGELVFKVAKKAGKELTDLDWSLVKTLALQAPDGKIYNVTILSDPTDPINQSIRNIKEIIKDEQGKIIKDKAGNGLAVTDEGSLAIVKDVEGTISKLDLLASNYPNLGKKIRELHNDLQEAFIKDFDGNVEVLTKFEGNEGWVDSWKVLVEARETGLASRLTDVEFIDDYLKNYPDVDPTDVANSIKTKGWQKWVDDLSVGSTRLDEFILLSNSNKLQEIKLAWDASYPQIFVERKLFEDVMGHYRYPKSSWGHTSEIAPNFKAIDFYKKGKVSGSNILTETVVSMKTTTTTDVNKWLISNPVKKNLDNLVAGIDEGITWDGKTILYNKAEVHIYMPKEKFTESIKAEWLKALIKERPDLEFQINIIDEFIQ